MWPKSQSNNQPMALENVSNLYYENCKTEQKPAHREKKSVHTIVSYFVLCYSTVKIISP